MRSLCKTIFLTAAASLIVSNMSEANPGEMTRAVSEPGGLPSKQAVYMREYSPRVNFQAALEPAAGIVHGAGQDPVSYQEYSMLFSEDHRPMMQMTYITITDGPEKVADWQERVQESLQDLEGQKTVLQIGLNMTTGNDDGSGAAEKVALGKFDDAIDQFVEALARFGVPAYVRIGYEFEGSWNGYSAPGFVSAFKYISSKMRNARLPDIATVWCAAGGSAEFIDFDQLMRFYPGDDYVDWWGVDIFSPEEMENVWLGEFYALASEHRKPVMIGEATPRYVGAGQGMKSWTSWYQPFFEMVRKHPEIKAISYINWDWVYWSDQLGFGWHDWEDARIQIDETVRELYIRELAHPIWIHAPDAQLINHSEASP